MIPTKEQFDSLSQLDRIEYRQRFDRISYHNPFIFFAYVFMALTLYSILLFTIRSDIFYFLNWAIWTFTITWHLIVLSVLAQFVIHYITKKERKELMAEYFIISPKNIAYTRSNRVDKRIKREKTSSKSIRR